MSKDWIGNTKSAIVTTGGSNYSKNERPQHDFYATSPEAVEALINHETFSKDIWEPAAGMLHISDTLEKHGYRVYSTDIIKRTPRVQYMDFLEADFLCRFPGDIITNPPYSKAQEFVEKALSIQ